MVVGRTNHGWSRPASRRGARRRHSKRGHRLGGGRHVQDNLQVGNLDGDTARGRGGGHRQTVLCRRVLSHQDKKGGRRFRALGSASQGGDRERRADTRRFRNRRQAARNSTFSETRIWEDRATRIRASARRRQEYRGGGRENFSTHAQRTDKGRVHSRQVFGTSDESHSRVDRPRGIRRE